MPFDEDGWGEGVVDYRWSASGNELLVQYTESIRILDLRASMKETTVFPCSSSDVFGMGYVDRDWWSLLKQGEEVVYRHGLDGDGQVLEGLSAKQVTFSTLSPDARTVACVVSKSRVYFWSVADGKKLFGIRMVQESESAEIFGPLSIEKMSWSPDSKYLAIYPGFPIQELTLIDVGQCKILEIVR